jgi:glycosyltransferase involved in cell wall biosynthesis
MKILVVGLGRINVDNKDGGSIRLYKVLRYLIRAKVNVQVMLPVRDLRNFIEYKVNASFRIIREPHILPDNIFFIYFWRIIAGCISIIEIKKIPDIVYSASDFWHDSIPAYLFKIIHPQVKLVTCLFLIAPSPNKRYENMFSDIQTLPRISTLIFYVTQRITILIGKRICDLFLVLNEFDKLRLISYGIDKNNIKVVSMGIDNQSIRPSPILFEACYLGRFHPQKGIDDLFPIWINIIKKYPKARLAVIGGGLTKDIIEFMNKIEKNKLSKNIIYLGYRDGVSKYKILRSSRILLVPSHYESWGQVIIEGLSVGLSVIAYRLPVYSEIIRNNIITVTPYNLTEFADKIIDYLSKPPKKLRYVKKSLNRYLWSKVCLNEFNKLKKLL